MFAGPVGGLPIFGGLVEVGIHALVGSKESYSTGQVFPLEGVVRDAFAAGRLIDGMRMADNEAIGEASRRLIRSNFVPWRNIEDALEHWSDDDPAFMPLNRD